MAPWKQWHMFNTCQVNCSFHQCCQHPFVHTVQHHFNIEVHNYFLQSDDQFFIHRRFWTFLSSNLNSLKCWYIYTELKCSKSQILFVMPLFCFVQVGIIWILLVIHLLNKVCLRSILFGSDSWHESVNIKQHIP